MLRLRQVALVAEDLAAAEREIEEALGVALCFRDPGVATFGLANALYPIGDKLLEVVSPTRPDTTAGRLLNKRGGDGGYMVILQTDELDAMRRRFADTEARVVFEAVTDGVVGLHLHPRDVGGAILSVDQTDQWEDWPWAGEHWRTAVRRDTVLDIVAVEIQAADPEAMAHRWADVLALAPGRDATVLDLDEGQIRFVPVADDRGEGVSAIELRATRTGDLDVCGTAVRLRR